MASGFFSGLAQFAPEADSDDTFSERYRHSKIYDQLTDLSDEKRKLRGDEIRESSEERAIYDQSFQKVTAVLESLSNIALHEISDTTISKEKAIEVANKHIAEIDKYKATHPDFKDPDFQLQADVIKSSYKTLLNSVLNKHEYAGILKSLNELHREDLESGIFANKYDASDEIITNAKNLQDGYVLEEKDAKVKALGLLMDEASRREYVKRTLAKYDIGEEAGDPWVQFKEDGDVGPSEREMVEAAQGHLEAGDITSAWNVLTGGQLAQKEDRKTIDAGLTAQLEALNAELRTEAENERAKIFQSYEKIKDLIPAREFDIANSTISSLTKKGTYSPQLWYNALDRDISGFLKLFDSESKAGKKIYGDMAGLDDEGKKYYLAGLIRKVGDQFVWNIGLKDGTAVVPYTAKKGENVGKPLPFHKFGDLTGTINRELVDDSRKALAEAFSPSKTIQRFGAKKEDTGKVSDVTSYEFFLYVGNVIEAELNNPLQKKESMRRARIADAIKNKEFSAEVVKQTRLSRLDLGAEGLADAVKGLKGKARKEATIKFFKEYKGDLTDEDRKEISGMSLKYIYEIKKK
jgi:hypothetical protein